MELIVFSILCVMLMATIGWYGYKIYQLDKPFRDWYSGNTPKNLNCRSYEDYLLYLNEKGLV